MSEVDAATVVDLLADGGGAVLVTVVSARGSTPREVGAAMVVTALTTIGTVGGGRLEASAIERARTMLRDGEHSARLDIPLGPEIGQCCGGRVGLQLKRADNRFVLDLRAREAAAALRRPQVLLFGAGHVGTALACALSPLPFAVSWLDEREGAFPTDPPANVAINRTDRLLDAVAAARPSSAFLVLTHDHGLDFALCEAVLRRGDFAYLGLIGSITKRRKFERGFKELGIAAETVARLTCPIGGTGVRDKRPAVIAALTAAELVTHLHNHEASQEEKPWPATAACAAAF